MEKSPLVRYFTLLGFGLAVVLSTSVALAYSIPAERLDAQKIFWGDAGNFETPGEVDYEAIIRATPEYKEIEKEKVERGTGKYWILMSQASGRALSAISQFGQEGEYDLIAARGYLGSLKPAIAAKNITDRVIKSMNAD